MGEILKRTWAQVNIDAIEHNYSCIRNIVKPECRILCVVKADAYGHGAPFIAKVLSAKGADYFGVSNIDEAAQLRKSDINEPILILGYTPKDYFEDLIKYDISQTIFSCEHAKELSETAAKLNKTIKIHIKTDTGMSRLGFLCNSKENIKKAAEEISSVALLPNLELEGIFTHFAVSDDLKSNYTQMQYDLFCDIIASLKHKGIEFKLKHCCNSAAIINYPQMQMDMVRPGIILYGLYPSKNIKDIGIKPAMELKTVISQIKEIEGDISVSYGRIYRTFHKTKIAVIPIGYADGFPRILSNNAEVLVGGERASVIGRVCMDMTMIDITNIKTAAEGQDVTIFGNDGDDYIPIEELADKMETINYEISCLIGKRVPRLYIKGGNAIGNHNYIL